MRSIDASAENRSLERAAVPTAHTLRISQMVIVAVTTGKRGLTNNGTYL